MLLWLLLLLLVCRSFIDGAKWECCSFAKKYFHTHTYATFCFKCVSFVGHARYLTSRVTSHRHYFVVAFPYIDIMNMFLFLYFYSADYTWVELMDEWSVMISFFIFFRMCLLRRGECKLGINKAIPSFFPWMVKRWKACWMLSFFTSC